jgi:hypothetical protein
MGRAAPSHAEMFDICTCAEALAAPGRVRERISQLRSVCYLIFCGFRPPGPLAAVGCALCCEL